MNWLRNNWLNLIVGIAILAIIGFGLSSLRGCGASSVTHNGPSPLFFVIFSIVMIIIGSRNRDQQYFGAPLLYFGIGLFVIASIGGLGTISGVFSKNPTYSTLLILGLVVVAGIYGYNKTGEGFLKRTIGAITAGLALFLVGLAIVKFSGINFDAKSFSFPNITIPEMEPLRWIADLFTTHPVISLFLTALGAGLLWRNKSTGKIAKLILGALAIILIILLLSDQIDHWIDRWPSKLSNPASIGQGIGNVGKGLGRYIPKPSRHQPPPAAVEWTKFDEVDFGKVSLGGVLKNPVGHLQLPRGTYLFSPTVQARFGKGGWCVQTQLTLTREEVVSLRPPGGDITKTVTIYRRG